MCDSVNMNGSQQLLIDIFKLQDKHLKTVSDTHRLMVIRSVNNSLWHELCAQVKTDPVSSRFMVSSESKKKKLWLSLKKQLCDQNEPGTT